jgi:hypothetical protein
MLINSSMLINISQTVKGAPPDSRRRFAASHGDWTFLLELEAARSAATPRP